MFSDNTTVIFEKRDYEDLEIKTCIQSLSSILQWLSCNKIITTFKKQIILTSIKCNPSIFIDNELISKTNATKFLGLVVDQYFTWHQHIDHILYIKNVIQACKD